MKPLNLKLWCLIPRDYYDASNQTEAYQPVLVRILNTNHDTFIEYQTAHAKLKPLNLKLRAQLDATYVPIPGPPLLVYFFHRCMQLWFKRQSDNPEVAVPSPKFVDKSNTFKEDGKIVDLLPYWNDITVLVNLKIQALTVVPAPTPAPAATIKTKTNQGDNKQVLNDNLDPVSRTEVTLPTSAKPKKNVIGIANIEAKGKHIPFIKELGHKHCAS